MNFTQTENTLTLSFEEDLVAAFVKKEVDSLSKKLQSYSYIELVVDLSVVEVVDSLGINLLVGFYKECKKMSRGFKVKGSSESIKRLFSLYNLSGYFNIS